jgi:hypothetical protein
MRVKLKIPFMIIVKHSISKLGRYLLSIKSRIAISVQSVLADNVSMLMSTFLCFPLRIIIAGIEG